MAGLELEQRDTYLAEPLEVESEEQEGQTERYVIPLVEETLLVGKEKIVTGGVRVSTVVTERTEVVDQALLRDEVQVDRIPINQHVLEAPQPRQEGDFWIIPVLEEVLIVEKRLVLKEEIRIRRTSTETHVPESIILRREEAVIEQIAPDAVQQA